MRYVTFDNDGNLTGSFIQELHPDHADHYLEVPEEIAAQWTRYRVNAGVLEMFEPPPTAPVVPESITPRQGRVILAQYGLLSQVDAYFAALAGDGAEVSRIEWEYAQEWRRDWQALVAAAASFGLTAEQIDQMFIAAAAL